MIFAAGRGERLRPLTDTVHKSLHVVGRETLLARHLRLLANAGCQKIVINSHWLADDVKAHALAHVPAGVDVSVVFEETMLETAGALRNVLPEWAEGCVAAISADIWSDVDYTRLWSDRHEPRALLVPPPPGHQDELSFQVAADGQLVYADNDTEGLLFSGMCTVPVSDIEKLSPGAVVPLRDVLDSWIQDQRASALVHMGRWCDIGTPKRLAALQADQED